MAKTDQAIVVGIACYPDPEFGDLGSPEHDATAFRDWLIAPDGGAVPDKNVELIVSSKFKPPFASSSDALPSLSEVQRALDRLHDRAISGGKAGNGMAIGRRLYLFFSGHGFSPDENEAAVYMANVARGRIGYHILGKYNADWFFNAGCFEEVLLFMDCCRQREVISSLNKPYDGVFDPTAPKRVKRLYAFATQWNKNARERPVGEVTRGVFTTALIAGLRGAAAGPDGLITTSTLRDFLTQHMGEFMSAEDKDDPNVSNEPDIYPYPKTGPGFVISEIVPRPVGLVQTVTQFFSPAKPEAPKFGVVVRVTADLIGKTIQMLDHELNPIGPPVEARLETHFDLQRGLYLLQIESNVQSRVVEVSGASGEVDVRI
jgi:Caspase domain